MLKLDEHADIDNVTNETNARLINLKRIIVTRKNIATKSQELSLSGKNF